jgi:spore maturation protein B
MLDSNLPAVADTLQTLAQNSSELSPGLFVRIMQIFSIWLIPVLIFAILILAWRNKVKVYEAFIDGAKEGFSVAIKIIPYLVAVLVAIGMFRASGAMDIFVALFSPITNLIGMPAETLPVALMRPLSGSGALGLVTELMKQHGPDSFIGRVASTMWGSTETTFYVVAVYFGSVGVRRVRHSIAAGLVGDAVGLIMAVIICRLVFG